MKRKTLKAFICCTLIAVALTFGACGSKSDTDANANAANTSAASEASADQASSTDEQTDSSLADLSQISTVEEFLNSDMMQSQLESLKSSLAEQGLDFDMAAEGNKLIYIYKYTDADIDPDATAEALSGQSDQTDEQLKSVYDALIEAGIEDPVIEAQFLAADGSEIFTQQHPAE